ncbi:F-box domain protein [Hortaea werneckii]|nr:F-box domain protein [Hortaea werneckii]KAI7342211.1 F-box domain protein [Hortaea werneckii]
MEWNAPDLNAWPTKVVLRISKALRSNKQFTQASIDRNNLKAAERRAKQREEHARRHKYTARASDEIAGSNQEGVNELGERDHSMFSQAETLVENRDDTDMLHRLAHHDSFDSLIDQSVGKEELRNPYFDSRAPGEELRRISTRHERMVESLPDDLWRYVTDYLNPADTACLAISSKTLMRKLGPQPLKDLNEPQNKNFKISVLHYLNPQLPRHLLCFPCAKFHLRLKPGKETLKADFVNNPLFNCPLVKTSTLPRTRLTHDRQLPYGWVQLALRSEISPAHGINPDSLARRWKHAESGWSHHTRYMIHDGRLLMRIVSQRVVPPARESTKTVERHLLYEMQEFTPYFSVCAHWRDGEMMDLCKCSLSHVPSPPQSYIQQLKKAPKIDKSLAHPNFIVRGCDWCRPARRCPECSTEYLVEIQMIEDAKDPARPFKHSIVVTRWSDLGDGSSPHTSAEWASMNGVNVADHEGGHEYESFSHVGRRAVSGIFESRLSGSIPGQRLLSLNPKNEKKGEEGHGWY